MKPQEIQPSTPLTVAQFDAKLTQLGEAIARKSIERETLQEAIPQLILQHTGSDLAAARERRKLTELSDELRGLEQSREILLQQQREARRHEFEAQWQRDYAEKFAPKGAQLEAAMVALQQAVDDVVPLTERVRAAVEAFQGALPTVPDEFSDQQMIATLMRRIALRLFSISDGQLRPPWRVYESSHQVHQSGRDDLVKWAQECVFLGLRANRNPPSKDSPPPHAA